MRILMYSLSIILVLIAVGCDHAIDRPTAPPTAPTQPETPTGLAVSISDRTVLLTWSVATPANARSYVVYYSDSSSTVDAMVLLDSTTSATYTADGLTNGQRYYFRVSVVDSRSRLEGVMSDPVSATPGVFAVNIAGGAFYTRSQSVSVDLTAPQTTQLVELSEDSLFTGAHWSSYSTVSSFEFSDGDGVKRLYARFQLSTGGNSIGQVSDTIILDRLATIDSVTATPTDSLLQPGDHIHLAVWTREIGGTASVTISPLGTIALNDRGLSGDSQADDGHYEVNYVVPVGTELSNAEVIGAFTDAAGNVASTKSAQKRLNLDFAPSAVVLSGIVVSSSELLLEWTRSTASDFSRYQIFRSASSNMSASELVTSITTQATITYRDTALDAGTEYYYRVSVTDNQGHSTPSNIAVFTTLANEAPGKISLAATQTTSDTLGVDLSWIQATDADFDYYRIIRSTVGLLGSASTVRIVSAQGTTSYIDHVPVKGDYYYWIYVYDKQGASTVSDSVYIQVQ